MNLIAKESGNGLIEADGRFYFVDFRTNFLYIFEFVNWILIVVLALNTIVQGLMLNFLLFGILAGCLLLTIAGLVLNRRLRRKRETLPETVYELEAKIIRGTIDQKRSVFIAPDGQEIPLQHGKLSYVFSMTSNSRPLCFISGNRKYLLAKGNPLTFNYHPFEYSVKKAGLKITS